MQGRILITGGTGSLGTAILERAEREKWDAQFTIVARNETKMNNARQRFPCVRGEIGDVRDADWLRTIFPGHDLIIHAAAIKIVPVAEANPREAVLTNTIGSLNVAQAAIESGIKRVIGISTDKACGPTYYGLTKRLMEGLFRQANQWGTTEFVLCRYGNVLRSNNSIVPLFERQIRENKPFTITDLRMTRFWLSMKMAVDLIIHTIDKASPGQIVVPKAPTMTLVDLARTLDPDREIIEIGIRPGERLNETLIIREEALHTYEYGDRFYINPPEKYNSHINMGSSLPDQYEYTSDNREHYLTQEKMKELLADS